LPMVSLLAELVPPLDLLAVGRSMGLYYRH
jgi:hypothetical protein